MRLATRVAAGSGLVLAILAAVVAYQLDVNRRMTASHRRLEQVELPAATRALELLEHLDALANHARKYAVTRDPAYAASVARERSAFAAGLDALQALGAGGLESDSVGRMALRWSDFELADVPAERMAATLTEIDASGGTGEMLAQVDDLRELAMETVMMTRRQAAARTEVVAAAGRRAARISIAAVVVAIGLSVLIILATVRSIQGPLRRLTAGTRAVARGEFSWQLDVAGDDEIAHLAEDFNAMVRRLDELDQMKRDFLSNVSHEIKTPLVAMLETDALLLEGAPGPLTSKQRRLLELHLQAGRRLRGMIANLLDLSRLEAGVMDYDMRPRDTAEIAAVAAAELLARAEERGVRLVTELKPGLPPVPCDADRIVQVIENLIDNALRVAPKGTSVVVSACLADGRSGGAAGPPGSGEAVELAVTDSGPGVPPELRERIFERFQRGARGGSVPGHQGFGLGLAICREIVAAHRGTIEVRNRPGGGARFVVVLPAAAGVGTAPSEEAVSGGAGGRDT